MPTVTIPATHFTNNVKHNYQEHRSALIREFVQNSVDAGATEIRFNFNEEDNTLEVWDNGHGMTQEVMVNALLTMSGSHKESGNAVGGFGAAKEILLFQHSFYNIHSRRDGVGTAVTGRQLDYEFVECNQDDDGTTVVIGFTDDYGLANFEPIARGYLNSCEVEADIYLNGSKINPTYTRGELVRELDWCNIYVNELPYDQHYAHIRINGVLMFSQWVAATKYEVIIELTKPSREILTVNRDGFTYEYSQQLNQLMYEISVEKGQFGKAYGQHVRWAGSNTSYNDVRIDGNIDVESIDDMFNQDENNQIRRATEQMAEVAAKAASNKRGSTHIDILNAAKEAVKEVKCDTYLADDDAYDKLDQIADNIILQINEMLCDHAADFHIHVQGKNIDKIPDHLKPNNWGKRTKKIAQLWKTCLRIVMRANNMSFPYCIGWVLDEDDSSVASCQEYEGMTILMLNPMLNWMNSSIHMHVFHEMLMTACHEVTHHVYKHHDERFIIEYERNLRNALCYVNRGKSSWWKHYMAAKEETI